MTLRLLSADKVQESANVCSPSRFRGGADTPAKIGARWQLFAPWTVIVAACLLAGAVPAQKEDYLSDEEVEKLREAQEPPARIKMLTELLEDRIDKARALKDPASVKPKPVEPKEGKKKGSRGKETPEAEPKKAVVPARSFATWMDHYLQCLEEVAANLENFSSVPMEPKAYLKSLKKLEESLQEHDQWMNQFAGKLNVEEKRVIGEITEVLQQVTTDVKSAVAETEERIKLLKEAQKAKSSRR